MILFSRLASVIQVSDRVLTPVPPDSYQPDTSFVKQVRVALADGSVSMGIGRMFTREDHDKLYNSLKNYKFTD